ncbi:hypothetical protein ACP26L_07140 [Paenibacillus sp. S-38]|uniref:hypothetical protein n=1 Tax=Paenibacillus sp. S-38 TaxID=3416710 RepID=UPI003CF207C1
MEYALGGVLQADHCAGRRTGDTVYLDGQILDEPYLADGLKRAAEQGRPNNVRHFPETVVPKGTVFGIGG